MVYLLKYDNTLLANFDHDVQSQPTNYAKEIIAYMCVRKHKYRLRTLTLIHQWDSYYLSGEKSGTGATALRTL